MRGIEWGEAVVNIHWLVGLSSSGGYCFHFHAGKELLLYIKILYEINHDLAIRKIEPSKVKC